MPEVIEDHRPEADAFAEGVDPFVIEFFRVDIAGDMNEVQVCGLPTGGSDPRRPRRGSSRLLASNSFTGGPPFRAKKHG